MSDRIMAASLENFVRVTHERDYRYTVEYITWRDNYPPTPCPYEYTDAFCEASTKKDAMAFAEAMASKHRIDIQYKPLVTKLQNQKEE